MLFRSFRINENTENFALKSDNCDILKYQVFSQTLQQTSGFGSDFKFPEAATSADGLNPAVTSSGGDEDDELY